MRLLNAFAPILPDAPLLNTQAKKVTKAASLEVLEVVEVVGMVPWPRREVHAILLNAFAKCIQIKASNKSGSPRSLRSHACGSSRRPGIWATAKGACKFVKWLNAVALILQDATVSNTQIKANNKSSSP